MRPVERLGCREQPPCRPRDQARRARRARKRGLATVACKVSRVAHADRHGKRAQPRLAQPLRHRFGQKVHERLRVLGTVDIMRAGQPVADALDRTPSPAADGVRGRNRRRILAAGERAQHKAHLPETAAQKLRRGARELADAVDARRVQLGARGRPHVQKVAHRRVPDEPPVVLRRDGGDRVGLAQVAAEFREHLVPRHADGHRAAQLRFDAPADLGRHAQGVAARKRKRPGEVEPALVEAERLHEVGVLAVDAPRQLRVAPVHVVARRHRHEPRALRARLPQRLARFHAGLLRTRALREHDAMARLLAPAHHERHAAQLGPLGLLDARIERVHVRMEDRAMHVRTLRRADRAPAERLGNAPPLHRRHAARLPSPRSILQGNACSHKNGEGASEQIVEFRQRRPRMAGKGHARPTFRTRIPRTRNGGKASCAPSEIGRGSAAA